MSGNGAGAQGAPLEVLERFRRPRPRPGEKCELCGVDIGDEHSHTVDLRNRSLLCTCRPCYLLFLRGGAGGGHYKAVPDRYVALPESALTRPEWEQLQIPVGVAFFFYSTTTEEVHCFYPGPAGATESLLPLDAWEMLQNMDPAMGTLEADVEALLVRAGREGDPSCYIVPIDSCYELVGALRMLWRGFDGGSDARAAIDAFFQRVQEQARPA